MQTYPMYIKYSGFRHSESHIETAELHMRAYLSLRTDKVRIEAHSFSIGDIDLCYPRLDTFLQKTVIPFYHPEHMHTTSAQFPPFTVMIHILTAATAEFLV